MSYVLSRVLFLFSGFGDPRVLHELTHSYPTRRSADLWSSASSAFFLLPIRWQPTISCSAPIATLRRQNAVSTCCARLLKKQFIRTLISTLLNHWVWEIGRAHV